MTEITVEVGSGGAMGQIEKSPPASLCLAQWVYPNIQAKSSGWNHKRPVTENKQEKEIKPSCLEQSLALKRV